MDLIEARALGPGTTHARHPWELARFDIVAHLLATRTTLQAGSIVLDVGCGDTFVAESLGARFPGIHVIAVDTAFDDEALQHYRDGAVRSGVSVYARCDDVPVAERRNVSLVLLMDVIEHVPDDAGLLRALIDDAIIGPDTTVLITVPAYQALFSSHDVQLQHYRRYAATTLRATAHRAGLRITHEGSFFLSLLPVRLMQLLGETVLPKPPGAPGLAAWHGSDARSRALAAMLYAEARCAIGLQRLGIPLPGLSRFAFCRRAD